jgi:putative restriction endonuclease
LPSDTPSDLLDAVRGIKPWKRGHERAPHKPLLLLLALGRIQRGEPREVAFTSVEDDLRQLLDRFGPARKAHHPEYPFWYLRNDGLWQVSEADQLPLKKGGGSPTISTLRKHDVTGGLPEAHDKLLRSSPSVITSAARILLDGHFPTSYHDDLLAAVGLSFDTAGDTETVTRKRRDPRFPRAVRLAYAHRCGVCGLDMQLDGRSVGLEAAHVWWHTHGGPSDVSNGIALCPLHHKALDLGAWGLDDDRRVLVSAQLHGGPRVEEAVGRYHGEALVGPRAGEAPVNVDFIRWHRREVFRAPERGVA